MRDVTPNLRVGAYYVAGAVLLALLAGAGRPWGAFLTWPALSFAVAAIGYFGAGPAIYRKKDGRLPLTTRVIMAPMLLLQDLSLRYYRRQCRPWDEAMPGLLMGRLLDGREAGDLLARGVTAVLDLTAEFSEAELLRGTAYCNLPILDLTAPTIFQLRSAVAFIREQSEKGVVYVHCKIGYSRTAAVVGAYLVAAGQARDADEAMARMREARPPMIIRPEAVAALRGFHQALENPSPYS